MRNLTRSARLLALVLCLGAGVVAISACEREKPENPDAGVPKQASVTVRNNAFDPAVATIAKGGTISWTNNDVIEYSLKSPGLFEEVLEVGETWTYTFQNTGEFRVYDDITPQPSEMKVVVK